MPAGKSSLRRHDAKTAGSAAPGADALRDRMAQATSQDLRALRPATRRDHVPLGILYMVGATLVFAASSATSKWLVDTYPVGEVLFTRAAVSLIACALFILP